MEDIRTSLKKYFQTHICPICGLKIKGHARSTCSNCGRIVCQRHMRPYIGTHKKCPHCRQRQHDFAKMSSMEIGRKIINAESRYNENDEFTANDMINEIFKDLFGD